MNFQKSSKARFLFLPHVGRIGGAGIYIDDFASFLKTKVDVSFGGEFGKAYTNDSTVPFDESVTKYVYPIYAGVSVRAMAYRLVANISKKNEARLSIKKNHIILQSFDVIVLTSSIQALIIEEIKSVAPDTKIVVIVQENVNLRLPFLSNYFLKKIKKADLVVSITDAWAASAKRKGVDTWLVRNTYDFETQCKFSGHNFDCLYVGGGSKLKGFELICHLIGSVGRYKAFSIALAGHYSFEQIQLINKIKRPLLEIGGGVHVVGFQENMSSLYQNSRFVLLPITKPHFCRPAIEAGAHGRTFVIPNFAELNDFVSDGENCLSYDNKSLKSMESSFIDLLTDPEKTKKLGAFNREMMLDRFGKDSYEKQINSLLLKISSLNTDMEKDSRK
jgi:glycosyltransferase involved in cell wall biosynthesis